MLLCRLKFVGVKPKRGNRHLSSPAALWKINGWLRPCAVSPVAFLSSQSFDVSPQLIVAPSFCVPRSSLDKSDSFKDKKSVCVFSQIY